MRTLLVMGPLALTLLAATVASPHAGLAPPETVHTLEQLTADSYALFGRGGNVGFVVGEDGVLLIDDQFADIAQAILDQIATVTPKPVKYLVNTHHHGDHTGGNALFAEMSLIVAHHDVRKYMLEAAAADPKIDVQEVPAPSLTYTKEVRIHLGSKAIRLLHIARGHTSGDTVVYVPEDEVVHVGDLCFNGLHPYIDVAHGGSTKEWVETLDAILSTLPAGVRVIPGHGKLTDLDGLRRFKGYLESLRREVGAAIGAGKSRAEAMESVTLAGYGDYVEVEGFTSLSGNVGIVYDELKGGK